jgi:HEAT repeat protein
MSFVTLRRLASVLLALGFAGLIAAPDLLAGPKDEEAKRLTELIKTSKDAKTRATAIEEIGKLAQINTKLGAPAVPEIRKALKDKDAGVRKAAALAFGRCDRSDEGSVAALLDVLKSDKDDGVKTNAALGLAAMGPKAKDALPALREAAKNAGDNKKNERIYKDAARSVAGAKN